jgi:hypothetical protein
MTPEKIRTGAAAGLFPNVGPPLISLSLQLTDCLVDLRGEGGRSRPRGLSSGELTGLRGMAHLTTRHAHGVVDAGNAPAAAFRRLAKPFRRAPVNCHKLPRFAAAEYRSSFYTSHNREYRGGMPCASEPRKSLPTAS